MEVHLDRNQDVDEWMKLVEEISWNFLGLETKEALNEHRETVIRFIGKGQALCVRNDTGDYDLSGVFEGRDLSLG